ncbi:Uncharacterised protein [Mycobacteroides abscessus subsp. abscessus]|nr:Uncharacterised protein [Mycobacteroides abscessus subsp. abscessus]
MTLALALALALAAHTRAAESALAAHALAAESALAASTLSAESGSAAAHSARSAPHSGTESALDARSRTDDRPLLGRGDGVDGVRERACECGDHRHRDRERTDVGALREQHCSTPDDPEEQHHVAQPRHKVRRPREQREAPDRRDPHRSGEHTPDPHLVARTPGHRGTTGEHGGDGRREGSGVVAVEDARHEAEHGHRHEQPQPPHDEVGTSCVGALGPTDDDQRGDTEHQCRRDQPGDLTPLLGLEHSQQSGLSPHAAAATGRARSREIGTHSAGPRCRTTVGTATHARPDAAGLVATEAAETVVAQRQFHHGVVL